MRRIGLAVVPVAVLTLALAVHASASTVTLYPTDDAWASQAYPDTNYNNDTLDVLGGNAEDIAYLRFDVGDAVPAGAVINSVTLTLQCTLIMSGAGSYFEIHQVTSPWTEGTLTWNNRPDYVADTSVVQEPLSDMFNAFTVSPSPYSFNVTGAYSAGYVDIAMLIANGTGWAYFVSKDTTDSTLWPRLTVNYTETPPDTTPPVVTLAAAPTVIWPPTGYNTRVSVSGTATDQSAITDAWLVVDDEYGLQSGTYPLTLNVDGTFALPLDLAATRDDTDTDGHTYTLTAYAQDAWGNVGQSAPVVVTVPHDVRQTRSKDHFR